MRCRYQIYSVGFFDYNVIEVVLLSSPSYVMRSTQEIALVDRNSILVEVFHHATFLNDIAHIQGLLYHGWVLTLMESHSD